MSTKLYSYEGQVITLPAEKAAAAFSAYEEKLRSSSFVYSQDNVFQAQIAEIKTAWPDSVMNVFKIKAREIAGVGNAVSASTIRKALQATGEHVAGERIKTSNRSLEFELAQVAGEIAVATLFKKAPNVETNSSSVPLVRKYLTNGKTIRVKPSITAASLFVNVGEIDSADIFILAFYLEASRSAYLLGFATKEQVKATEADKARKVVQIPLDKLHPMKALYVEAGLSEVPPGVSFETVPNPKHLPIVLKRDVQAMLQPNKANDFDMLADLGITSTPTSQPAAVKTETSDL